MSYSNFLVEARDNLKKTLEFISKHNLPPTPVCYTIAYEYVSNKNHQIVDDINNAVDERGRVDVAFMSELYDRFFRCNSIESTNWFYSEVEKLIAEVLGHLKSTGSGVEQYGSTLENHLTTIKKGLDPDTLKIIVNDLILSTQNAIDSTVSMQKCLDSVREEARVLRQQIETIKEEASTDMLTGLLNRKSLEKEINELIEEANSNKSELALLMADIDHFKKFNDNYGHVVGDEVIQYVGKHIKKCVRGTDIAGRYGGEEFSVILPNTHIYGAMKVAETIRQSVEKIRLVKKHTSEKLPPITLSLGIALYKQNESKENFVNRADRALYHSKQNGRNRTTSEHEVPLS